MTPEATNALLKTLEEPPADLLLILTTDQPHRLLPTIRSRCQQLRLRALERQEIIRALQDRTEIEPERLERLAGVAEGSLGRALTWADDASKAYWQWLDHITQLVKEGTAIERLKLAERLASEKLGAGNERILELLQLWYRDALILQVMDQDDQVVLRDRVPQLRQVAEHCSIKAISQALQAINEARSALATYVHGYLTFLVLFNHLSRAWPAALPLKRLNSGTLTLRSTGHSA